MQVISILFSFRFKLISRVRFGNPQKIAGARIKNVDILKFLFSFYSVEKFGDGVETNSLILLIHCDFKLAGVSFTHTLQRQ